MKYPRQWKHKETGKIVKAMPWWECTDPMFTEEDAPNLLEGDKRAFKIGALVQVGWLLENEHGVWLGLGPKSHESFEDITE